MNIHSYRLLNQFDAPQLTLTMKKQNNSTDRQIRLII